MCALLQDQIVADMFSASLNDSNGLVARYDFQDENTKKGLPGPNGIARVINPYWGPCQGLCQGLCLHAM